MGTSTNTVLVQYTGTSIIISFNLAIFFTPSFFFLFELKFSTAAKSTRNTHNTHNTHPPTMEGLNPMRTTDQRMEHSLKTAETVTVTDVVEEALSRLDDVVEFPIRCQEVQTLLRVIATRRHTEGSGASARTHGWSKWVELETSAGLSLLRESARATGDDRIERASFLQFFRARPALLGPLSRMERCFKSYDYDGKKRLDVDKMASLMLDVEAEKASTRSVLPGTECRASVVTPRKVAILMNARIRTYFKKYVKKKRKGATFLEFCVMALEMPNMLATAPGMRAFFIDQDLDKDGSLGRGDIRSMVRNFCLLRGYEIRECLFFFSSTTRVLSCSHDDVFFLTPPETCVVSSFKRTRGGDNGNAGRSGRGWEREHKLWRVRIVCHKKRDVDN